MTLNPCKCGRQAVRDNAPAKRFKYYVRCLCGARTTLTMDEATADTLWNKGDLIIQPESKRKLS